MRVETVPALPAAKPKPAQPAAKPGFAARHPWWPKAQRVIGIAFLLLVLALVVKLASAMDWDAAWQALKQLPASTLALAAGLAAAGHLLYSTFDLVGRQETRHGLPVPRVMSVAFVSYVCNLNFGSLVGGVAFRYRLYSKLGLAADVVTRVVALSMLTNWLGYLVLGGLVLLLVPPSFPPGWDLSQGALPLLGAALLALAAAYVGLCLFSRQREWSVRGHELKLPSARVALLQLVVSMANWLLIASIVYVLLQQRVDYPHVLGALLLAAVAGVATHVPAGLGVLEAVFMAVLSGVPQGQMLAALLAYRALYYLAPLALAGAMFLWLERSAAAATTQQPATAAR